MFDPWTQAKLIQQNCFYFKRKRKRSLEPNVNLLCILRLPEVERVIWPLHILYILLHRQSVLTRISKNVIQNKTKNPFNQFPWRPAGWKESNQTIDAYSLKSLSSSNLHYFDFILTRKPIKPQWNNVIL